METKNVTIVVNSSIRHPGQDEELHKLQATGQLIQKTSNSYLKFEEEQNGQEVLTTVKLSAEDALIMRTGAVTMRLPFILNGKRKGIYGSGAATFELIVKTERLKLTEEKDGSGGRFEVSYDLLAEGSVLGKYKLNITYMEGTP